MGQEPKAFAPLIGSRGSSDFIRPADPVRAKRPDMATEGCQPFTAEIKTLAKGAVHI